MSDLDFQLDPNRHAQPAELQVLRANLALDVETLETLKTRTAKAAAIVCDAKQKARMAIEALDSARAIHSRCAAECDEVQERITYARGLMHPIRRLPDELLQAIMLAEITEAAGDAMNFETTILKSELQARRRLRRLPYCLAAVSRAWRHVAMRSPALWVHIVLDFNDIRIAKRWTPARATKGLDKQLVRAAKRDLILLVHGEPTAKPVGDWFVMEIWTPPILCRVAHIKMGLTETGVRDLDVSGFGLSRLLTAKFYSTGLVQYPSIPSNLFNWMASSITALRFDNCLLPWSRVCPLPALRSMASIDFDLNIRTDLLGDDDPPLGTIEFNNVQDLCLIACTARPVCTALRFPNVIKAELSVLGQVQDACALLLQHAVASFDTNQLRSLSLRSTDASEALARVFYELQLVEDITMYSCQHTEDFCDLMSKKDERGRWALPRLSKLDIQDHCLDVERSEELLEDELLQMIRQRQEISRDHTSGLATLVHCDVLYSSFVDAVSKDFDVKLQHAIFAGL